MNLNLSNLTGGLIDGRGATWTSEGHSPILTITNCHELTVQNATFKGPGKLTTPNSIYYALAELRGVNSRITFRDCTFRDGGDHGIGHLNGDRTSTHILVERCRFIGGGNYAAPSGLIWDGAAVAVGGQDITVRDCYIEDWIRGVEIENPFSDASFMIANNRIVHCSHAAVWITPTGFLNKISGQVFTGNILMNEIGDGQVVPNGFRPAGIVVRGGMDILIAHNQVFGVPYGIFLDASTAPIDTVQVIGNNAQRCELPFWFKDGSEGLKCKATGLVQSANLFGGGPQ